jgi:hypothetical protein
MLGDRWLSVARTWLDEGVVDRTIEPLVADWQHELAATRGHRRLLLVARGHVALARSVIVCGLRDLRRPLPMSISLGAWLVAEIFVALGTLITLGLTAWSAPHESIWLMIPANLALAVPLAAVPLLIIVTRHWSVEPRTARWLGVRTAFILTALNLVLAGWIMPDFNQQWREAADAGRDGRPIAVGFREMTLPQLLTPTTGDGNERARRREMHNRLAVIVMPISLSVLGLAVSRRVRTAILGAVGWWILTAFLWFTVLPVGNGLLRATAVAHLGSWSPHATMLLISLVLNRRLGALAEERQA